jgi:hypothetical protein
MGTMSKTVRDASMVARQANAKRRQRLAKKLGVSPGDLMPFKIEATIASGRVKREDIPEEMLPPKPHPTKRVVKEVLIPGHAIPATIQRVVRETAAKLKHVSDTDIKHMAQLIVAVSRELWK